MFERFDDPEPFRPDDAFRTAVHHRAGAIRRRRRRVLTAGTSAVVAVAVVGGAALYVDRRDAAIDRVDVSTQPSTDGATNVLLVGADGPLAEAARADSIAILRFDDTGARLLSLPRDLHDETGAIRVNGALAGGPQAMIDAVRRTTGIPVDHYVALDPQGFVDLVDAAGGLRLAVDRPLRDGATGLQLLAAECTTLDGETALSLARSRRLESFADGEWQTDPRADLGRIDRQQSMLGAALDQLDADPATIDRLSRLLADHAVVDEGLDLAALVSLGTRLASGTALRTEVLPVTDLRLPTGAVVLAPTPEAAGVVAAFGSAGLPTEPVEHRSPPATVGDEGAPPVPGAIGRCP